MKSKDKSDRMKHFQLCYEDEYQTGFKYYDVRFEKWVKICIPKK